MVGKPGIGVGSRCGIGVGSWRGIGSAVGRRATGADDASWRRSVAAPVEGYILSEDGLFQFQQPAARLDAALPTEVAADAVGMTQGGSLLAAAVQRQHQEGAQSLVLGAALYQRLEVADGGAMLPEGEQALGAVRLGRTQHRRQAHGLGSDGGQVAHPLVRIASRQGKGAIEELEGGCVV